MRIKERLSLNLAVSAVSALAVGLVFLFAAHRVNIFMERSRLTDQITNGLFERSTFRSDYLETGSERAKEQWFIKHDQIGGLLKSASETFKDPERKAIIDALLRDQEATGRIFTEIVATRERMESEPASADIYRQVEDRLAAQLNMRLYDKTLLGRRLQDITSHDFVSALSLMGWGILCLILVISGAGILNSWSLGRSIGDRIRKLQQGALSFGKGDLEHRIEVQGGDELAELSRGFNDMALKLRLSYHDLQGSEQRWATTLASIGDAVIATDTEGRVTFMNAVAEGLTGWSLDEAKTKPVTEVFKIINENTRAAAEDPVSRVLREGMVVGLANHTVLVRRDGTEVPIDDSGAPIRDKDGKTMGVVLVFRDITERKRAEAATAVMSALVQSADEAIISKDLNGVIRSWNAGAEKIFGYTAEEAVGRNISFLVPPGRSDEVPDIIRRIVQGEHIEHFETERVRKDGTVIPVLLAFGAIKDAGGKVIGISKIAHDITELRRMEEVLRRAHDELEVRVRERTADLAKAHEEIKTERQRLFDVLETLPAMICLLTPDYHVAFANRAFRERFGESGGRHCYEYCFGRTEPCGFCESYRALETGEPHHWEVTSPDGKSVIAAHDFPFTDVDGSPLILEMDLDITEQRLAEKSLKELNETLEQRVAERTSELKNALDEKEVLLKELYHRTKNNMNVISNLMVLQAGQIKDPGMKQLFKEAQNRVLTMALVHEMLYKTKDLSKLDLKEYLEQLVRFILSSYHRKDIGLKLEMDSAPVSLYLALPCGLIVNELLSNSIKHAFPENHPSAVAIRLKTIGKDLELSYSDNGVGLPEGFRIKDSNSLGMRILDGIITKQLMGDWKITSNNGITVVIRFKSDLQEGVA